MNQFSKIGFTLAAAGSAVGLGNIWRFPYVTGEYGGGAFVIIYLIAIVFIALVMFLAEVAIGQYSQKDISTSFVKISKSKNKVWGIGGFPAITSLIVLSFYSVVLGWVLSFFVKSFTYLPENAKIAKENFTSLMSGDVGMLIFYHTIIASIVVFIVLKGIIEGIERANLILMPLLGLILIGLFVYAFNLESFPKAVSFMFSPDFSKINNEAVLAALGQAFFTLSLGMGTIMTYAASLPKENNIVKSSINIALIDTIIAIVAGLIIFSFLFEAGAKSSAGPGLVFISLPVIFNSWGVLGHIIAVAFFIALLFAGITSAISAIEPTLKIFVEKFGMTRVKATVIGGLIFYFFGILAILSMSKIYGEHLTFFGKNLFDWMDFGTSSILMPIGAIFVSIFLGFFVEKKILEDIFLRFLNKSIFNFWYFLLKFIVPLVIVIIFLNKLGIIGDS